jgi:NADPH-dependent 2,4-dienoyl-CoA reductase/sulfur reductase-like enzyme
MKKNRFIALSLIVLFSFSRVEAQPRKTEYDVLIYGSTASGVMAAIAASQEGAKVILVEPGRHVGGMVTGGLSHSDYAIDSGNWWFGHRFLQESCGTLQHTCLLLERSRTSRW